MKKSLSLILAIAMVFSMFATTAFAAEVSLDAQAKYDALKAKGIFEGTDGGAAALDENMTRAQFAKIVTLLDGLTEDASGAAIYNDLDGAGWAAGYIGAATNAGHFDGVAPGQFNPAGEVTLEQLATVMVRVLDLQVEANVQVAGASDWAKGYVAAAIKAGVISNAANFTVSATREALVNSTYTADLVIEAANVLSAELAATGAKQFTVTFNKAVDASATTFVVKNGSATVNTSEVAFAADNKSATITLSGKIFKGDYSVVVNGAAAEAVSTNVVTTEDEKVAKIDITTDVAPVTDNVNRTSMVINYKAYNQYNEDTTKMAGRPTIQWQATISNGTPSDNLKGKVTFTAPNTLKYDKDAKVTITGIQSTSAAIATKVIIIGDAAKVASAQVIELYNAEGKTIDTGKDFAQWQLLITANDQYGNKLKASDLTANDLIITSSNPTVVGVEPVGNAQDDQGADTNMIGLKLSKPANNLDGTATISLIPAFGGTINTFAITVMKKSQVETISLINPGEVVGAGQSVTIPFTAVDQNGAEIVKYDDLVNNVTLSNTANTAIAFSKDYSGGVTEAKGKLKWTAPSTTGTYVLMAVVKDTGKVSQMTIDVKDAKVARTVTKVDGFKPTVTKDGETKIEWKNITVQDQYGQDMTLDFDFFTNYSIRVEIADHNKDVLDLAQTGATVTASTYSLDITGKVGNGKEVKLKGLTTTGSEKIKVSVVNGTNVVAGSEKEVYVKNVALKDIKSYEVKDITTVYGPTGTNGATNTYQKLDVYGKTSDGSKVVIPQTQWIASTTITGLTVSGGKLIGDTISYTGDATEKSGNVVVVVTGYEGPVNITKPVTVSKSARKVGVLVQESTPSLTIKDGVASGSNVTIAAVLETFTYNETTKDQYGNKLSSAELLPLISSISVTNITGATTVTNNNAANATLANVTQGDAFNVTIVTTNAQVATFKVDVK